MMVGDQKMRKTIIVGIAISVLLSSLAATAIAGKIHIVVPCYGFVGGIVVDAFSKQPLPKVDIYAFRIRFSRSQYPSNLHVVAKHAKTDEHGTYQMILPAGRYLVRALKDGYRSSMRIIRVIPNACVECSFKLVRETDVDKPPIADFTYTPEHPLVNETVIFDASSSKDDGRIISYYWSYTSKYKAHFPVSMGEGEKIKYCWTKPGVYIVTLRVIDDHGNKATVSKEVTVRKKTEIQPIISIPLPSHYLKIIIKIKGGINPNIPPISPKLLHAQLRPAFPDGDGHEGEHGDGWGYVE